MISLRRATQSQFAMEMATTYKPTWSAVSLPHQEFFIQLWLPTLFSLFYLIHGSLIHQTKFLHLVMSVAEDNVCIEISNPDTTLPVSTSRDYVIATTKPKFRPFTVPCDPQKPYKNNP